MVAVVQPPAEPPTSTALRPFAIVAAEVIRTGGMDRANLALADYLVRHGHPVDAVAHRVSSELFRYPNFTFHRVYKPFDSYFLGGPLLNLAGRRMGKKMQKVGGRLVVNGGNCRIGGDINWVHYVHAAYYPAGVFSLARGIKNVMAHRTFLREEATSLKAARIVIANSDLTRRHLIDHVGVSAERIRTVYYGNDPEIFVPPSEEKRSENRAQLKWPADRPVAIFIGALGDRRKGFDTLFAAWKTLCEKPGWDVDLVVVGRGAELPAWKERAAAAGMGTRICFLGFRKDVPDLLRAADVLVAPTRYEAYGLGVQEALCCGVPAVVSADAGVAERYPAELQSLLLPDCEDAADLAARLIEWRGNAEKLRAAVLTLCGEMRSRSWDQMAKEIVDADVEWSARPSFVETSASST